MKNLCLKRIVSSCFKKVFFLMAIGITSLLQAADGTWTNTAGGLWNNVTNWNNEVVAGGMDFTADFSTLNLLTTISVNVDAPTSIGTLLFGDTDIGSSGWYNFYNNGSETNTLTVTNVVVNAFAATAGAALYPVLQGSGALVKSGTGRLVLVNTNTYSGGTSVNQGSLRVGNAGTTGGIGTGPVSIASGANLFYDFSASGIANLPSGSNISGNGALSAVAGKVWINGDITLGGAISLTQNSGATLYNGIDLNTHATLTASSITLNADIGQHNETPWAMLLDTSATNGPVNLDISLSRNGVWYQMSSFTVNAGIGPINLSGARVGANGVGFRNVPVTLKGAINMYGNLYTESSLTINATTNGSISGAIYGTGGSLVKAGPSTLKLSGRNTYTGPTVVKAGTLELGQPAVTGAARHFDASNLGLANGAAVSQWNDLSGNGHHATVPTSDSNVAPTYIADAGTGTGLGALNFLKNSGAANSSALRFTRDSAIRSVFSIFKGNSFLLTDNTSTSAEYHFHRPTDDSPTDPLWVGYTSGNIRGGQTYVNGLLTNCTVYNMPTAQHNGYNLVEVITTGNVIADSFNKDRYSIHAGNQSHAEMIIFDRALSESERLQTEAYLMKKWFGIGEGAGDTLPTSTALTLEGKAVLDMTGLQRQTVTSLTTSAGSKILLGDATLVVSGAGRISGEVSGTGGKLVKQGTGTLQLLGAASYSGATIITGGVLQVVNVKVDVPATNPVPGATRWFDASSLSLTNGQQVTQWDDLSGNNANATVPSGNAKPAYLADAGSGTGLGAVSFLRNTDAKNSQALGFARNTDVRSVFSIFKGSGFLLTDSAEYDLHRPGDVNPADALLTNYGQINYLGKVYVNGAEVLNPTADAMPTTLNNGFNLISIVSNGNTMQLDSFNKDRTYHSGNQSHAEVIIYNRVLSEQERLAVERYLMKKWFGIGYSGSLPNAPMVLGGGATLDPGGTSATLGTLTLAGNAMIAVGDGSTSLNFADSSGITWSGTLTLTGTLGPQTLRFGTSSTALTYEQQRKITIDGKPVRLDGNGYAFIVPDGTRISFE
jgi:fibronectin-binding autotransporter adhesin